MPHCPRCEKRFTTLQKLCRHINQTSSSCANLIDDLIALSRPLQPSSRQNLGPQLEPEDFNVYFPDNNDFDALPHGDIEMGPPNFEPNTSSDVNKSKYREDFVGASKTFGTGLTFMKGFDLDEFSDHRRKNLYYPFASKADWEMASFLLRSGLSMAKIDDFLKLQLVSACTRNSNIYSLIPSH
jgi:hypothetical protein